MSMFDEDHPYAVYRYVLDESGEPTAYQGQIVSFVMAQDPWTACEIAGFDDMNLYGASRVDENELGKYQKSIDEERKLLSNLTKQLKPMIENYKKKMSECPNCEGVQLDKAGRCPSCSFGHEKKELLEDVKKQIKEAKKNGEDVSDLNKLKKAIENAIKEEDKLASQDD